MNPFLDRKKKEEKQPRSYWRSKKQERSTAKELGIRQISRSGAGRKKGDLYAPNLARVECKCTQNKSFSITRDMLDKIANAGVASGEIPIVQVEFVNTKGEPLESVAVLPMWALKDLLQRARGEGDE